MSLDVYLECPHCHHAVFEANITHNLANMAEAAGIGYAVWKPEQLAITIAWELVERLREGIACLRSAPSSFDRYAPKNGWGSYDGLVTFLEDYLAACIAHPEASVRVSR